MTSLNHYVSHLNILLWKMKASLMRYLSSSVETILLSRLSRVDVDYFYKTIKYSKFHGT